jgi:hypothetical protein
MFVMPISLTCLGLWASIDCAITFLASLPENIESIFLEQRFFGKPLSKAFTSQILPSDSIEVDSLFSL